MMPRVFVWIGRLLLIVALAVLATYNTGYVLVVVSPYRIQLSLNLLLVTGILAGWLLLSGWRGWRKVMTLSQSVVALREQQARRKAQQALAEAQRCLWMKEYPAALVAATEAYPHCEMPGIAAIVAWQATHALRDVELCQQWLEKARQFPEQEPVIAALQAEMGECRRTG